MRRKKEIAPKDRRPYMSLKNVFRRIFPSRSKNARPGKAHAWSASHTKTVMTHEFDSSIYHSVIWFHRNMPFNLASRPQRGAVCLLGLLISWATWPESSPRHSSQYFTTGGERTHFLSFPSHRSLLKLPHKNNLDPTSLLLLGRRASGMFGKQKCVNQASDRLVLWCGISFPPSFLFPVGAPFSPSTAYGQSSFMTTWASHCTLVCPCRRTKAPCTTIWATKLNAAKKIRGFHGEESL